VQQRSVLAGIQSQVEDALSTRHVRCDSVEENGRLK
jgi:hypothetical protein